MYHISTKKIYFDAVIVTKFGDKKYYTNINISGYPVKIDGFPNIKFVVHNTVDELSLSRTLRGLWDLSELTTGAGFFVKETMTRSKIETIEAVLAIFKEKNITEKQILKAIEKAKKEINA